MGTLTDAAVRAAVRAGKNRRLSDGQGRGSGRLVLVVKSRPAGVSADWYAQQWRDGRRHTVKIGAYPVMSLAQARHRFTTDYADTIAAGQRLTEAAAKAGTVADLVDAYCDHLDARGAASADDTRKRLAGFVAHVGGDRQARDVTPADVVAWLRPTYQRGAASLADHNRGHVRAAYSWALRADYDYRADTGGRRFSLTGNPAADIPTAPKVVGTRWLDVDEWRHLYRWLGAPTNRLTPSYTVALRLLLLTGQRVQEVAGLRFDQWEPDAKVLRWRTTKNGRAHVIPVCDRAAELLDSMPRGGDWLFPMETDPTRPVGQGVLYTALWRNREAIGLASFTNRDLRRTWKTLAGQAGLSKWERDLLQNHARADVSAVHYDRHDYLDEKRGAVGRWGEWVEGVLA